MKIRVLTESGCGLTKQEANDLGIDFSSLIDKLISLNI